MIYIHVPFCRSFCTYCDFFSKAVPKCHTSAQQISQDKLFNKYVDSLCLEIKDRKEEIIVSNRNGVDTIYYGGGTPSVLSLEHFQKIMSSLEDIGVKKPFSEFTIEVNPEDVVQKGASYIEGLASLGVNRVSMGVQSFDDSLLKWMNRRHSAKQAAEAVDLLRKAGIDNISLDLIFGISHLDETTWKDTIDKALVLNPEHISCYQLSIEEGSALNILMERGLYKEASEDKCFKQYSYLCHRLSEEGYLHYEISNFCRDGKSAKHNSAYWDRLPYTGLGPGAHSFDGEIRKWNSEDLSDWTSENEILSEEDKTIETIMLSLRTSKGIDKDYLMEHSLKGTVLRMLEEGLLAETDFSRIRIPEEKFFISDSIIKELI